MSSHLLPVFSSAHSSCVSIYVKPPVFVSPHPSFLQQTCGCLLHGSPQAAPSFPMYFHSLSCSAGVLCSTNPYFLSFCHMLYLPVSDALIPLSHSAFLSHFLHCCFLQHLPCSLSLTSQEATKASADVLLSSFFQTSFY